MSALNMYDCAKTAQHAVLGHFATRVKFYDSSMIEDLEKELKMIALVKESIDNNEFTFYFQPQCDIATGKVVGAEALIRWQRKASEKTLMPSEFIPLLEKMDFITDVDLYLWELVCRWLRRWLDMGRRPVPVSINISRIDFFLMDVPKHLKRMLQKYDLPVGLLKIEITETVYAEESSIQENVNTLRANGFMVMLDDFGSGYSSMSMLSNIQVDALKIDLKFLQLSDGNRKRGRSIIETLINFFRQLEVPVIIEGVETEQQREFLASIGCHYAQGYNFYRPMPIDAFEKLISDENMIAPPESLRRGRAEILQIDGLFKSYGLISSSIDFLLGAGAIYEMRGNQIYILRTNEAYLRLCGAARPGENSYEKRFASHYLPEDEEKILAAFRRALDNPYGGATCRFKLRRADGSVVDAHMRLLFLRYVDEGARFIGMLNDLSD